MKIQLKKFGTTLISRQLGKEAYAAFLPSINDIDKGEIIKIDFEGVCTFSPSWGDEFLTPLMLKYKLILINTTNLSVKETIKMLEKVNKYKFDIAS